MSVLQNLMKLEGGGTEEYCGMFYLLHSVDCFSCIRDELLWHGLQKTY